VPKKGDNRVQDTCDDQGRQYDRDDPRLSQYSSHQSPDRGVWNGLPDGGIHDPACLFAIEARCLGAVPHLPWRRRRPLGPPIATHLDEIAATQLGWLGCIRPRRGSAGESLSFGLLRSAMATALRTRKASRATAGSAWVGQKTLPGAPMPGRPGNPAGSVMSNRARVSGSASRHFQDGSKCYATCSSLPF